MRWLRNVLAIIAVLLLLIVATPLVQWSAERLSDTWGRDDADVLVVLGGSMLIPGTGPNATFGYDTYLRCVTAALVARTGHYRYIIVSGGDGLSQSMQRFLVSQGIDRDRILQENAAQTTYENALFTKRILSGLHPGHLPRVVVLTSDIHSRRARLTFQRAGFDAASVPAADVIKRCSTMFYRLEGAATIAIEVVKLASYKVKGYA